MSARLPALPSRLPAALLAALGVYVSAWPLRGLFEQPSWNAVFLVALAVIVGIGSVLRAARLPRPVVVGGQAAAVAVVLLVAQGGGTLVLGLFPTGATVEHWSALLLDAFETVRAYPAPAPATPGVTFFLAAALAAVALVTDCVGVTCRLPALAGLPMLAPFLVAVANSDGALPATQFLATAACWLALVAQSDHDVFARWIGGRGEGLASAARARGVTAVSLAAAGLVVAVAGAAVTPHLPVRYLTGGLGDAGAGGTGGQVGFSPDTDLLRDLRSTNTDPVLSYRTDDPTPQPLRVAVSTDYRDGRWRPERVTAPVSDRPTVDHPPGLSPDTPSTPRTIFVHDNRLAAPYVATPVPVVGGSLQGARWSIDPRTGVLAADRSPDGYQLTYLDLEPAPTQLRSAPPRPMTRGIERALDTEEVSAAVATAAEEVTRGARTPYEQALAIQRFFRDSGGFTYSLEPAPPPPGMSRQEAGRTSVDRFLESRQGYCVQFATAMVLMSRSLGIPARLATGFLPGTAEGDTRRVIAADAHAWPELYVEDVGWLRFEPTPAVQSGPAPGYAPDAASDAPTQGATPTPTAAPTPTGAEAEPTPGEAQQPHLDTGAPGADESGGLGRLLGPAALVALLAGLGLVPLAARWSRRRRLAEAADEADRVEAVWEVLRDDLEDLGVRPDPAATPADAEARLRRDLDLDAEPGAALARLTRTVQAVRYAPPGGGVALREAGADAAVVRRAATRSRPWSRRLRALLWPRSGRDAIRRRLRG